MTTKIIGIHGLANKSPKDILKQWWIDSIKEGLRKNADLSDPNLDFQMVYWADLLYAQPLHRNEGYEFDPNYNDEPYMEAVSGELKEYEEGWLDSVREKAGDVVGGMIDLTHGLFGTDALSKFFIDKVLRDLSFYYDTQREIRDRNGEMRSARRVLMDECSNALKNLQRNDGDQVVVIGHSMGSIIAYDVLREIGREDSGLKIDHFVTIGSPMGLPTVKANIYQLNKDREKEDHVRTPTIVGKSWVNFADRLDPVCFDNHLSSDYGPNASDVRVRDDIVVNDYRGENDKDGKPAQSRSLAKRNHHKSYGYLRTPEFSNLLAEII